MAYDRQGSVRRRKTVEKPRAYVVIAEDHGQLFTVWQTCLANDSTHATCSHALWCSCTRHESGPTLMLEVRSYDTMDAAIACVDTMNEPLLFGADGRQMPPQPRSVPPATREGSKGDGYQYSLEDGGVIDESEIPF